MRTVFFQLCLYICDFRTGQTFSVTFRSYFIFWTFFQFVSRHVQDRIRAVLSPFM